MSLTRPKLSLNVLGAAGALSLLAGSAVASPLDEEACARVKGEQEQLVRSGTKSNMERGPAWAKANLSPEKLKDIERFIELQEQFLFRCPQKPPPEIAEEVPPAKAPPKTKRPLAKAATTGVGEESALPQVKPKAQPAAAPSAKAASGNSPPSPARKAPPKPKEKPNDAYIPPVKLDGE